MPQSFPAVDFALRNQAARATRRSASATSPARSSPPPSSTRPAPAPARSSSSSSRTRSTSSPTRSRRWRSPSTPSRTPPPTSRRSWSRSRSRPARLPRRLAHGDGADLEEVRRPAAARRQLLEVRPLGRCCCSSTRPGARASPTATSPRWTPATSTPTSTRSSTSRCQRRRLWPPTSPDRTAASRMHAWPQAPSRCLIPYRRR